jgi:hypothetical protein
VAPHSFAQRGEAWRVVARGGALTLAPSAAAKVVVPAVDAAAVKHIVLAVHYGGALPYLTDVSAVRCCLFVNKFGGGICAIPCTCGDARVAVQRAPSCTAEWAGQNPQAALGEGTAQTTELLHRECPLQHKKVFSRFEKNFIVWEIPRQSVSKT